MNFNRFQKKQIARNFFPFFQKIGVGWLSIFLFCQPIFADSPPLKFWTFLNPNWLQPVITQFEKENPKVKVEVERLTYQEGRNKIIIAFSANQGPDVLELGSTWAVDFIQAGAFAKMESSVFSSEKYYGVDAGIWEGKIYAVPWLVAVSALFYNEKLLKAAGFSAPPKNWEELCNQVQKIHNPQKRIYGFGWKLGAESMWQKFLPFAWSNGVDVLSQNVDQNVGENTTQNIIQVQTPPFLQAVKLMKTLGDFGLVEDNLRVRHAFLQGRVAFMLDDAGQMAYLKKNAPTLQFSVAPLPNSNITSQHQTFQGAQLLAINQKSSQPDLALQWIQTLMRPENVELVTNKILTLYPALKESLHSSFYQKHPELLVFLQELAYGRSPLKVKNWILIQKKLTFALERVLFGLASAEEAMKDLQAEIQPILSENSALKK